MVINSLEALEYSDPCKVTWFRTVHCWKLKTLQSFEMLGYIMQSLDHFFPGNFTILAFIRNKPIFSSSHFLCLIAITINVAAAFRSLRTVQSLCVIKDCLHWGRSVLGTLGHFCPDFWKLTFTSRCLGNDVLSSFWKMMMICSRTPVLLSLLGEWFPWGFFLTISKTV